MAPKIFTVSFYKSLADMPQGHLFRKIRPYLFAVAVTVIASALILHFIGTVKRHYACKMTAFELWRNDEMRTTSCDWYEGKERHTLYCAYYPDGRQLGCGSTVEGVFWDGIHVEWWQYDTETTPDRGYGVPKAIRQYEAGEPVDIWRFYRRNGVPLKEQWFSNGMARRIVTYDAEGKKIETPVDNKNEEME